MKKINGFLNILIWIFLGFFFGVTIVCYHIDRAYPERFAERSAPWYCYESFSAFILFLFVLLICMAVKLIFRLIRHSKKKTNDASIAPPMNRT